MAFHTNKLRYLWDECQSAMRGIHAGKAPTSAYAFRGARLLYGTGAHESDGFRFNRQKRFGFTSGNGAHGYWQQESICIKECMRQLDNRDALRDNAATWYFGSAESDSDWYSDMPLATLLQLTCADARLSLMWARIYYILDPAPIPESIEDQATYWGRVYNTRNEATKNAQWERHYIQWANGVIPPRGDGSVVA